jgi:Ni,Fe-hydrogenase III small subunit
MRDFLRARLTQGTPTSEVAPDRVKLPERFRGRLAGDPAPGRALPIVDAGACLFSPEEATASAAGALAFTGDHRLSSRTREGLASPGGEIELATALEERTRALFGRSLRLRSVVAGSCGGCEAELVALSNVVFDLARFGVDFVASPRHADGIVITGAVNRNMRDALTRTWAAVPAPRIVIAVGACAVSGGPFRGGSEVSDGVPDDIPVDLWIAGCPPHPLTMLDGLLRLLGRFDAEADGGTGAVRGAGTTGR